ncbi:hypothetical protein A0H81_14796, partial [Grifola frondosa]
NAIIESTTLTPGTKVQLWCLQIPLPKVAPIVVAAIRVPNDFDAVPLVALSDRIWRGLRDCSIHVTSYSCDGTDVERIPSPHAGDYELSTTVTVFEKQPLVVIHDVKHARKTYRNGVFSVARLFPFGNHTAMYRRIRAIAFEKDSPLYHRDVDKIDRRDDNAASWLFSARCLRFLVEHHPEYLGEVLVLSADHFVKMWRSYLTGAGYSSYSRYFLSRPAVDITRILIEGLFALIMVYRDYCTGRDTTFPLRPWPHSSEACNHVFGQARQVVKVFTFMDFLSMVGKLRIKIRQVVLLVESSNSKARASAAFDEAESLVAHLGILPSQLHSADIVIHLPNISSWFDGGKDVDEDEDEEESQVDTGDAAELRHIDDERLTLTFAAVSTTVDDMIRTAALPDVDDEFEEVLAEGCQQIYDSMAAALSSVDAWDAPEKPFGQGILSVNQFDFSFLVELREQHQTCEAAEGVRTSSIRAEKEEQHDRGVGTGKERDIPWCESGSATQSGSAGNSRNAATVAASVAGAAVKRRLNIFTKAGVPSHLLHYIAGARVSPTMPLRIGQYAVIQVHEQIGGITIGQVIGIYFSYVAVQVLEHVHGKQFLSIPSATSRFGPKQFALLPSTAFLSNLDHQPKVQGSVQIIKDIDVPLFRAIQTALKLFVTEETSQPVAPTPVLTYSNKARTVRFAIDENVRTVPLVEYNSSVDDEDAHGELDEDPMVANKDDNAAKRKAIESPPRSWERKRPREASTSPESDSNGDGPMDETTEGTWHCMPASHMEIDVESNTAFVMPPTNPNHPSIDKFLSQDPTCLNAHLADIIEMQQIISDMFIDKTEHQHDLEDAGQSSQMDTVSAVEPSIDEHRGGSDVSHLGNTGGKDFSCIPDVTVECLRIYSEEYRS